MNNVLIDRQKIDILANAISNKSGVPVTMTLDEMVEAVDSIETGGGVPTLETVTKTYTPSTSAVMDTITPSSGYDGIEEVDVMVSAMPIGARGIPSWVKSKSSTAYILQAAFPNITAGYISSIPAISTTLSLENKVIDPTENQQTVEPTDINYYLNSVTVNAIPSNYVGSGITQRSSSDLTASGATVTAPAGYYSAAVSKSVTSGSATAPASISGTAASVSTDTNTLTLTKTVSVTPNITTAGYINSGTAGNSSVSLTANITTKAAATITPTTTNQTIAAGTYLTGTQTIVGDADLIGSNILSTANIFGVQGTVVVYNYYTGSSIPSSSLGENGDLYFQTED